jgi:hypothetical protein
MADVQSCIDASNPNPKDKAKDRKKTTWEDLRSMHEILLNADVGTDVYDLLKEGLIDR